MTIEISNGIQFRPQTCNLGPRGKRFTDDKGQERRGKRAKTVEGWMASQGRWSAWGADKATALKNLKAVVPAVRPLVVERL